MTDFDPSAFEKRIGFSFVDKMFIKTAFTHRSYLNEHKGHKGEHNERLEFLGDAVMELVVTDYLYKKYPASDEGLLTSIRSALVNTVSISEEAQRLGINEYLLLSKGEARDTGRARNYILANTFESVVGALFLDQGYAAAEKFLHQTVIRKTEDVVKKRLWQDPKSRFQELSQEKESHTPRYEVLEQQGPDHDKQFISGVHLGTELVAKGEGKSKQEAEQAAASAALEVRGW
jgi:ribonuclease III